MPLPTTAILGVAAAALAAAIGVRADAIAGGNRVEIAHSGNSGATMLVARAACYDQYEGDNGVGIVSTKFEPEFKEFSSRGADDFTLSRACTVRSIDIAGTYFNYQGPLLNASIVLYRDGGDAPGDVIARRTVPASGVDQQLGYFHIPLYDPIVLDAGSYWLGFRVRMDLLVGGEWGWGTNNTQRGNPAMWKNHGGGFGTSCPTYGILVDCGWNGDQGLDFAFALNAAP